MREWTDLGAALEVRLGEARGWVGGGCESNMRPEGQPVGHPAAAAGRGPRLLSGLTMVGFRQAPSPPPPAPPELGWGGTRGSHSEGPERTVDLEGGGVTGRLMDSDGRS